MTRGRHWRLARQMHRILVPDADAMGCSFLASKDVLPPAEYRLRMTADDMCWCSRRDVLEAGLRA